MKIIPERLYRKIRYRKGYGVHSPFAYNFIVNIIEEKLPYYVFEDIEKRRTELLNNKDTVEFSSQKGVIKKKTVAEITLKETQSGKYGALLFRLVNFMQSKHILQVGASTGIMTLYMASVRKDMQCIVLEERKELVPIVQEQCDALSLNHVKVEQGEYLNLIENVLKKQDYFDLIFLNTARNPELTHKILSKHICTRFLVVDGIYRDKKTKVLWESVKNNPHAKITIDLYYLGIALFDGKFYKKHYKVHFDNGKGQFQK